MGTLLSICFKGDYENILGVSQPKTNKRKRNEKLKYTLKHKKCDPNVDGRAASKPPPSAFRRPSAGNPNSPQQQDHDAAKEQRRDSTKAMRDPRRDPPSEYHRGDARKPQTPWTSGRESQSDPRRDSGGTDSRVEGGASFLCPAGKSMAPNSRPSSPSGKRHISFKESTFAIPSSPSGISK